MKKSLEEIDAAFKLALQSRLTAVDIQAQLCRLIQGQNGCTVRLSLFVPEFRCNFDLVVFLESGAPIAVVEVYPRRVERSTIFGLPVFKCKEQSQIAETAEFILDLVNQSF